MVDLCERFGRYRMYAEHEQYDTAIGRGLAPRHDAITNFLRNGTEAAEPEPLAALAVRTSYFREEYAYGRDERIAGIAPFLYNEAFVEAARAVHGRAVVEPAIAYANLMVPGQQLAVHTDVPEFRGANRKLLPQWLLVVMHHSGLFEDYRMPIATAIAWFHDCDGGELAYWAAGPNAAPQQHRVRYNTAMVLDTDSRVPRRRTDRRRTRPMSFLASASGTTLDYDGDRSWSLRDAEGEALAKYDWDQLRFSVSWKAYCFRDAEERDDWQHHRNDLTLDVILDRLVEDLARRGRRRARRCARRELGQLLIDEYIRFPGFHNTVHRLILYRSTGRAVVRSRHDVRSALR